MSRPHLLAGSALACLALCHTVAARAQQASTIETVTVTARDQTENLQQTTIAITALDSAQLDHRG